MIKVKTTAICDECGDKLEVDDTTLVLPYIRSQGWYATPKILLCPDCLRLNRNPDAWWDDVPLRQVTVHAPDGTIVNNYITSGKSYDEAINKVSAYRKKHYVSSYSPDETYEGRAWNYGTIRVM